jgi:hypothetical protein
MDVRGSHRSMANSTDVAQNQIADDRQKLAARVTFRLIQSRGPRGGCSSLFAALTAPKASASECYLPDSCDENRLQMGTKAGIGCVAKRLARELFAWWWFCLSLGGTKERSPRCMA